jgi:xylulokinase
MSSLLLGIDVGTEGVKLVALDQKGMVVGSTRVSYSFEVPQPGWTEQDPEVWWTAVKQAFKQLEDKGIPLKHTCSIGVTGQMHSAVLLDQSRQVVRKAILWNDQRTNQECEEIKEIIGKDSLMEITCNTALPGFTAPKLLWIRKHEPEIYDQISHVLMPKDYIRFRLTGEIAADVTDASGTGVFDVEARRWAKTIIDQLGFPMSWFPLVYESSQVVAKIHKEAARGCGLPEGIPVVAGAGDNAAAAIGNAVYRSGEGMISVGTSGVVFAPIDRLPSKEVRILGNPTVHLFCHALPNTWYAMGVTLAAGGSLRWFRDALAPGSNYNELVDPTKEIQPGSEGLVFLPYLTGERTPHDDAQARGVFFGMNLRHRRDHFVRAILEGVSYSMLDCLRLLESSGKEVSSFVLTGGIVNSKVWSQILADVLGKKLQIPVAFEGPAIGAAVLAGIGIGVWETPYDAIHGQVSQSQWVTPNEKNHEIYEAYFQKYQELYQALKPIF